MISHIMWIKRGVREPGGCGAGYKDMHEAVRGGKEIVVAWGKTDAVELIFDVDSGHTAFIGRRRCGMCAGKRIWRSGEAWLAISCRVKIGVAIRRLCVAHGEWGAWKCHTNAWGERARIWTVVGVEWYASHLLLQT